MITRRSFLASSTATITLLPYAAHAAAHAGDSFSTMSGEIVIHPVGHASFVMDTPAGTIYVDPVGEAGRYDGLNDPDLILITHEHGDHYNVDTLNALVKGGTTPIITNPAVYDMLPDNLKDNAEAIANGAAAVWNEVGIDAIPAYNLTEDRLQYHPKGRDNGYVLSIDGRLVYIAGDTEDIPEMRALENIDIAFVPMNLPYTMDVNAAANAVAEFKPTYVYPYHYRGSDTAEFARLVQEAAADRVEVKLIDWYG